MFHEMKKYAEKNGLRIKDATASVKVDVTPTDIRRGKPNSPMGCAFAVACKHSMPGNDVQQAFFTRRLAFIHQGKTLWRYLLTARVSKEVFSFDRTSIMTPGVYTLSAITKSKKLGTKRSSGPSGVRNPNAKPRAHVAHVRKVDNMKLDLAGVKTKK